MRKRLPLLGWVKVPGWSAIKSKVPAVVALEARRFPWPCGPLALDVEIG